MRRRIVFLLLLAGCVDKAKADYDRCVDLDRNYDVKGAVAACSAAVAADSKSPSGLAAADKLLQLQRVQDKLKVEADDKAKRDAKIAQEDPIAPSATASVAAVATTQNVVTSPDAGSESIVLQAQALLESGDPAGARALLDPVVFGRNKPPKDAVKLMAGVCKAQKDRKCLAAVKKLR